MTQKEAQRQTGLTAREVELPIEPEFKIDPNTVRIGDQHRFQLGQEICTTDQFVTVEPDGRRVLHRVSHTAFHLMFWGSSYAEAVRRFKIAQAAGRTTDESAKKALEALAAA